MTDLFILADTLPSFPHHEARASGAWLDIGWDESRLYSRQVSDPRWAAFARHIHQGNPLSKIGQFEIDAAPELAYILVREPQKSDLFQKFFNDPAARLLLPESGKIQTSRRGLGFDFCPTLAALGHVAQQARANATVSVRDILDLTADLFEMAGSDVISLRSFVSVHPWYEGNHPALRFSAVLGRRLISAQPEPH